MRIPWYQKARLTAHYRHGYIAVLQDRRIVGPLMRYLLKTWIGRAYTRIVKNFSDRLQEWLQNGRM